MDGWLLNESIPDFFGFFSNMIFGEPKSVYICNNSQKKQTNSGHKLL